MHFVRGGRPLAPVGVLPVRAGLERQEVSTETRREENGGTYEDSPAGGRDLSAAADRGEEAGMDSCVEPNVNDFGLVITEQGEAKAE